MHNTMKKYQVVFTETTVENKKLKWKNTQMEQSLEKATQESTLKQLADTKLRQDYADALAVLDRIPKEVLVVYTCGSGRKEQPIEQKFVAIICGGFSFVRICKFIMEVHYFEKR